MFDYQLIRSDRRRTVALQIKNGRMIIRAPQFLSQQQIDVIIKNKSAWLQKKLDDSAQVACINETQFVAGCYIWIRGKHKTLSITFGKGSSFTELSDEVLVTLSQRIKAKCTDPTHLSLQVKKLYAAWLKEQTHNYIDERLSLLSRISGLAPKSFKVRFYKARWGSCNNRGELSFNYLLMMTPLWVIDYVIIHELCHLKHLNHSIKFWQLVNLHCPNYKEAKLWLKSHQSQLVWQ